MGLFFSDAPSKPTDNKNKSKSKNKENKNVRNGFIQVLLD